MPVSTRLRRFGQVVAEQHLRLALLAQTNFPPAQIRVESLAVVALRKCLAYGAHLGGHEFLGAQKQWSDLLCPIAVV